MLNQQYIGMDIGKDKIDIHLHPANKSFTINNNKSAISRFNKEVLSKYDIALIVMEPTGGYEKIARNLLSEIYPLYVCHANNAKNFARALNIKAKTDKIDAILLAKYGLFMSEQGKVSKFNYNKSQEELKDLMIRRYQLSEEVLKETSRLKIKQGVVKNSIKKHLTFLKKEILVINNLIEKAIESNEKTANTKKIITSFTGAGNQSAHTLISILPELGEVNKKQIISIAGLAPHNKESGSSKNKGHIQGGRAPIRKILYMAALVAIRHNKIIKPYYEKLIKKGKPFKVAIVAVMRKILIILNTMVKNNEDWKFAN